MDLNWNKHDVLYALTADMSFDLSVFTPKQENGVGTVDTVPSNGFERILTEYKQIQWSKGF